MIGPAIVKETQLLLHDRGALLSLFVLPLVFVTMFGTMFGGGDAAEKPRTLALWHAPGGGPGDAVADAVAGSGMFAVRGEASPEAVRAWVAGGDGRVGLIVPADFDPAHDHPAELVIDEGAPLPFRAPLQGAITGIVARVVFGVPPGGDHALVVPRTPPGIAPPLEVSNGFQVSVPGNSVLFGFFLALTVALSFTEEKKTGTWRRLLAAPVPRPVLLLAKLVPYYVVGLIQMAVLFGVGAGAFGMRVGGSPVALVLLTMAVVFCAVSLGLLIASFGGTQKQVGSVGSITVLVLGLLGGAMVPRIMMPPSIQHLGLATPHAWALDGYYDLLMREGTGLADVARSILAVCGFGVVFAAIGAWRFKFEK